MFLALVVQTVDSNILKINPGQRVTVKSVIHLSSNQGLNGNDHNVWLHVVINKINGLIVNYIFRTYAIDFFSPK